MNKDLIIFILSYGRKRVPTLKQIQRKENVIILTSKDNEFKDKIVSEGARVLVFDKDDFKYRGLEMMNEESVPQKRSAVYAYNYAIEYGRKEGYKYVLVLDDDYIGTSSVNDRNGGHHPMIDIWASHAVEFMKKHPFIGASCAINTGQLFSGAKKAYINNLKKRQLMNTIIFNTEVKHYFQSLGNGDYCDTMVLNTYSKFAIVRLATFTITMETIASKKHNTIDYSNLFYSRYSAKMICPAYASVEFDKIGRNFKRFNTHCRGNNSPKIVNL